MAHPFKKSLSIFLMILSITACGQQGMPVLPDDPNNEPSSVSSSTSGDQSQSSSAPSTQEVAPTAPADISEREKILKLYDYVDPTHIVPDKHLEEALIYYHQNKVKLKNPSFLSVIDFGQSSAKSRFYIINMTTGSVWNIHVAHGKGSDSNHDGYAEKFSNVSGSNASSLGFYLTAETYEGNNGYSLRLDGLSSTNSNVRARAVVIHGANYVQDVNVIQGRTWGCPAVSMANRTKVINLLKGGSLIYAGK
ncbi:MAG: murein L,D-transpeptidase catalytic domain family protein [Bdellovibrio sp.]